MGVVVLATVVWLFTRRLITVGLITFIHHATFLLVFYLHERIWTLLRRDLGKWKNIIKAFTYEIMLGMGIGGTIVLLVTGQWSAVTKITLTYTAVKLIMYYIYDRIWLKIENK